MTDNIEPTVPEGKADVALDQRRRAEKYGMPIENAHHIINRHFGVADDNAALAGGQMAADIEMSKALSGKG
ncbi:hypothetical protein [Sphingomonas soli]|uniref:hypothetical protein n=1 Tax=Sphingomonas soli TaxID=266127 RepID=UPI0008345685|nr:hypothetical protein [Sphingomonas soli]